MLSPHEREEKKISLSLDHSPPPTPTTSAPIDVCRLLHSYRAPAPAVLAERRYVGRPPPSEQRCCTSLPVAPSSPSSSAPSHARSYSDAPWSSAAPRSAASSWALLLLACISCMPPGQAPHRPPRKLAFPPYLETVNWSKVRVFWVDERVIPVDHLDINYKLVIDGLLSKVVQLHHVNFLVDELPVGPHATVHPYSFGYPGMTSRSVVDQCRYYDLMDDYPPYTAKFSTIVMAPRPPKTPSEPSVSVTP